MEIKTYKNYMKSNGVHGLLNFEKHIFFSCLGSTENKQTMEKIDI